MLRGWLRLSLFLLFCNLEAEVYDIAVASMFKNCAPYIREWVVYHQMIGVDHFWLYDNGSTDNGAEVIQDFIEKGIVELFDWPSNNSDWCSAQIQAFRNGLERGLGTAEWIVLLDQDEFILPMKDGSLKECMKRHFGDVGAVYMSWRNFGTSHVTLAPGESMLPRLTFASLRNHPSNATGKSIIRTKCADLSQYHCQHYCALKPGYKYVNGSGGETLRFHGSVLSTDGFTYDQFIRVNHYAHRDEAYFWGYRIMSHGDPNQLMEHYISFNQTQDFEILNFIQKRREIK